jgi:DNA (cytosine-5)-methyltransferase 1
VNELALFAGAGGGILGGKLLGWTTVCAVEIEKYPREVLLQRQRDGILEPFPIWDDICTFDGKPWRGLVDVISGGFPCQDISSAGKGAGITGERSGLWKEMARVIGEVRPRYALIENSPMLVTRGLDVVLCDLAQMGYDAEWGIVSAANVGAPHSRKRIWIVANADSAGCTREGQAQPEKRWSDTESAWRSQDVANSNKNRCEQMEQPVTSRENSKEATGTPEYCSITGMWQWWEVEPDVGRVANWVASRVDRLKAIGNGQVSRVVEVAWQILTERLKWSQK